MREELDFKSLRFFSALFRLGNVSPAAEALNISQPTGSLLLKKLREHFDDPLFVRIGQRMVPTQMILLRPFLLFFNWSITSSLATLNLTPKPAHVISLSA